MEQQPLISVYMPTFNRCGLLSRAIESVLSQSEGDFELLVVDDNSTDGTSDFLSQSAQRDNRLRWWSKPTTIPRGAPGSRNYAIQRARGKFITGLDDDDYFGRDRLRNFLNGWDGRCVAMYSNSVVVGKKGRKKVVRRYEVSRDDLLCVNAVGSQLFTSTERLQSSGLFDERLPVWQDLELWYRLLAENRGVMRNTGCVDYYFDESHSLSRISHAQSKDIGWTFNYFVEKHSLTEREARLLKVQLYRYRPSQMSWTTALAGGPLTRPEFWRELSKIYVKKILSC